MAHVVVVGAGVVGLSTAYYLRRDGHEVTVLEQHEVGGGASWGNAGWIVPSLVAPVPGPGMIGLGLRSLLDPDGAFAVSPRHAVRLAPWLLHFARCCTRGRQQAGMLATARLAAWAADSFQALLDDGITYRRCSTGLLFAGRHREKVEQLRGSMSPLAEFGVAVPTALLDLAQLQDHEPALSDTAEAGFFVSTDWALDPASLLSALATRLHAMGVVVVAPAKVCGFEHRHGHVHAAMTSAGRVPADRFILAAGAWTPQLVRRLGRRLPIIAGTGYSFSVTPPLMPRSSVYLLDAKAALTPLGPSELRIAGTMALTGIGAGFDSRRAEALDRSVGRFLRNWQVGTGTQAWHGMRPLAPDGLPVIGALPGWGNVHVNSGHGMLGVTLGPVSGRLLTESLHRPAGNPLLAPFDPARFTRRGS